jgi:hypothetical protein
MIPPLVLGVEMIVMMPKLLNERTALDVGVQSPDGRI